MPLLSAALIVRDEERMLSDCLESLKGVADEIVVVDTGSRDRTREVAHAAGVRLHEFAWRDDFAAARNEAVSRCRGDWILYIDADERVRPGSGGDLEPVLRDQGAIAQQVRFHVRPGFTPYWELRLFRNDPVLRFTGVIHENIWPAVLRLIADRGGQVGRTSLTIDHLGYEQDQERKQRRDLKLLVRAVETDPTAVFCWYELGRIYYEQGGIDAARAALARGIEVVRAKPALAPQDSLPFAELAVIALRTGDPAPEPLLAEALELFPEQPHLIWLEGRRLLDERQFDAAALRFHVLASRGNDELIDPALAHDMRLFGAWPLAGLATCRFAEGAYAEAANLFAAASTGDPDALEYRVKHALAARLANAADCQVTSCSARNDSRQERTSASGGSPSS
jgi:hypothetical protein